MAGRSSWLLRIASFVAGLTLVAVVVGVAMEGPDLVRAMKRAVIDPPLNGTTFFFLVGLVLVFLVGLPLAIMDGLASKRFQDAEQRLRKLRPDALVTPYDGPEGKGLRFESPSGVVLLLAPVGGLGQTRMVELPPVGNSPAPS